MARGVTSPTTTAQPANLPQVSFVKVQSDSSTAPAGTHDHQARSYGYNDFSEFRRPEHYIRYIEPLESELAIQVEYDMDEQDREWLDALNAERKKEFLNPVSYEVFEIIMDRLEKEWFDLTKNISKHDFAMPSEDSTCAICDDSEGENTNAIVFCDGCNLAVHQECYGVPYIPEGQWLCRKCTVSPEIPVSCMLCPNEGGAFKQTVTGEWVHLLCAIWVPETRVANEVFMEPVTGVERISKQRWKLKCSICEIREGACIQCAKTSCFLAFHATCARRQKLLMPMKIAQGTEPAALTCFCEKHLPPEQQKIRKAAMEAGQLEEDMGIGTKLSKSARAYARTYKPGPPLVPNIIVERIMLYIGKVMIRKKAEFVLLLCKYWSLKREARRGAPLLKRLHLEPWTASAGPKQHTEQEKVMKLELLKRLRQDLESVRVLTELSRKRESRKLRQAGIIQEILSRFFFSHEVALRQALEKIMSFDRQDYYRFPVSKVDVPDYFDVIKNPMCWTTIEGKLDRHEYWDVQSFKNDVDLVLNNAILYNKAGSPFYKAAARIHASAKPIIEELDKLSHPSAFRPPEDGADPALPDASVEPSVGDLEPSMDTLELLVSADTIRDNLDITLDQDPISSLLSHELAKPKSPPPSLTPATKAPKAKLPKRGRKPKTIARIAAANALDSSPGFRAPRTRQSTVRAAALEAEADATAHGSKSKRAGAPLTGQAEVLPIVDDVNNRESFKMFDAGWILPPDSKRGGRAPVDRSPLLPAKKRVKSAATDSMSSGSRPREQKRMSVENPSEPKCTVIQQLNGTLIIETLDTPSIRRAKAQRKKAERNAQLAASAAAFTTTPQRVDSSPVAGPSRLPALGADIDMESELTSLSGASSDAENEGPMNIDRAVVEHRKDERDARTEDATTKHPFPSIKLTQQSLADAASTSAAKEPPARAADAWVPLEGGTLVWAKAESFPWWPAVIFEEDDEEIPDAVLDAKAPRKGYEGPLQLVRFYDRKSSWQWVGTDRLMMLGNEELDKELLASHSRRQKWKSQGIRHECNLAYQRALAEMEIENPGEGEGSGDVGNDGRAGEDGGVGGGGGGGGTIVG